MLKKIILIFLLLGISTLNSNLAYALDEPSYAKLNTVDLWTFNEYRYKITDEFFEFRNKYELNQTINEASAKRIALLAKNGYNYLPDSLTNKNYYNHLVTAISKGIKYPNNESNYTSILVAIDNYLEETNIQKIKWSVDASPKIWNAPLTVTLRWNVSDPTGTQIQSYNYTWWIYENWAKKILWDNITQTHTFNEEWNFSVFLDVSSSHKNNAGYTDVLPFSSRADITVKEKIASIIIKVNSTSLRNYDELKFTPEEASYWLLFDATSSSPTSGAEFIETSWDFWNGVKTVYKWDPKVERVIYANEWEYTVTLNLKTNELKQVEREFLIIVHDPIATIKSSLEEWFLWDKFTFSAQNWWNDKNLSYAWEVIDLEKDEVILRKAWTLFTYSFNEKWKYNVKMIVTEPSWESDVDSKIIYINSRPPTADFTNRIPFPNKPNRVYLDATKSFDPDFSDDGKLKYSWIIDWNRVEIEDPNFNGSTWYFTFESIWEHSVILKVEDLDWISSQKVDKISINSILSVEFFAFPRVAQRLNTIRFISESPEAKFYEWDFWDRKTNGWKDENTQHKYEKSGMFNVKLKVKDKDGKENSFTKNVYIWESGMPYSFISVKDVTKNDIVYNPEACGWLWGYVINRVDSITLSWEESINITGETTWLSYSWKLGKNSYKNTKNITQKFDELGCFPIKLTVKSDDNWKTHSTNVNLDVQNLKPILSSVDVRVINTETDPVIVNIDALWAQDRDWVIQSYLWYYYTDIDSEPQDFRSTKLPSTSFVLPKVTWNYYFVVVMKDNNEELISSEDLTGSKYFIALTWDNLNTPLVNLSVNDSSIAIWDEAIFTASVENILGQDLSNKVKYSWDFDWDGFYDKESDSKTESYKFLSSGEKHIKVKTKYKWFSNTKTITINVSNVLKPDFWYISIWSKFIFFDQSIGSIDSKQWDLWDDTIIKNDEFVVHKYNDSKVSHEVILKIAEWTKIKEIAKKVVKNVKNIILSRKQGLILFSNFDIKDDEIVLDEMWQEVFVYLGESKPDITNFVVDYDIEYDSDLNWTDDDDESNKELDSYTSWNPIKIELNKNKYQTFRAFIKNASWSLVASRDIRIVKNYVEEELIDIDNIVFEGVSDSTKLKIEKLKDYVNTLPKQHKLKALMYVQKLQEEWSDNREKTNIILEFEWFIYDMQLENSNDIIDLLESLLVENQKDKSEKAITYNALKNLLPTSIICTDNTTWAQTQCYDELVWKLEAIRDNENIEENKILWSEILKVVAVNELMTNKQKTDFKAILKTFVYGWVNNIPDDEKQQIIEEEETSQSNFLGLFFSIIKWILYIILWFTWIVALYYIYYLLVNKDKNIWFQDFIIEKTSWVKQTKQEKSKTIEDDVLWELKVEEKEEEKEEEVKEKNKDKKEEKKTPILSTGYTTLNSFPSDEKEAADSIKEKKEKLQIEEPKVEEVNKEVNKEEVPDWLKGSFSEVDKKEEKEKQPHITSPEEEEQVEEPKIEEPKKEEKKDKEITDKEITDKEIEEATKIEEDNVPDWLKWSFTEDKKEDKKEEKKKEKPKKEQTKTKAEKADDNIPDWLKWSFEEDKKIEKKKDKKQDTKVKVETQETKKTESKPTKQPVKNKQKQTSKKEIKPKTEKKEIKKKEPIKTNKKVTKQAKVKEKKPEVKKDKQSSTNSELWDDGMKVPDWLKTDDEK